MPRRYKCEFKTCFCTKFILHCNNLCFHCKHANIWHSLKEKPPSDSYLSFVSPRQSARKPIYKRRNIIEIFEPRVPPLPSDSEDDIVYCTDIEILPV